MRKPLNQILVKMGLCVRIVPSLKLRERVIGTHFCGQMATLKRQRLSILVDRVCLYSTGIGAWCFASEFKVLKNKNLLFLEEPWVGKEPEEECQFALSEFYKTARTEDDLSDASLTIQRDCGLFSEIGEEWGFSESSYRELVESISQVEEIGITGFFGYSFASVRASYIDFPLEWAVFVKPYPVGVSGNEIVAERQSIISESIISNNGEISSVEIDDRSFPVDEFDYASAEVALGYLSGDQLKVAESALRKQDSPTLVGELSDSLWMRYGVSSISPGYLAYLQEVCRLGSDWQAIGSDFEIESQRILSKIHMPCRSDVSAGSLPDVVAEDICIISASRDPVAPGYLLDGSVGFKGEVDRIEADIASHSANENVSKCFA